MTLYIGFDTMPVSDWRRVLREPKAPRNYKDEDKIAEYVRAESERQKERAGRIVCAGRLRSVVVYKNDEEVLATDIRPGCELMQQIARYFDGQDDWYGHSLEYSPVFIGFDVGLALRLAADEMAADYGASDFNLTKLLELALDPYQTVVPEEQRSDIDLAALCRHAGYVLAEPDTLTKARLLAQAARGIAKRFALDD